MTSLVASRLEIQVSRRPRHPDKGIAAQEEAISYRIVLTPVKFTRGSWLS
jgi:hypothetical protein